MKKKNELGEMADESDHAKKYYKNTMKVTPKRPFSLKNTTKKTTAQPPKPKSPKKLGYK